MYKICIIPNISCFTNFQSNSYYSMTSNQFIEYFFPIPNIDNNIINNQNDQYNIAIFGIYDNSIYINNNKINILICIENITNPKFTWYNHYNKYGEYGNKLINIYIYNHITKIYKTNTFIAFPCIYFRINYFNSKNGYYFNHQELNISFQNKYFCLMINKSNINNNIHKFIEKIKYIGKIDNIHQYNHLILNKSCYNSIELLKIFNKYKFIICFENSYNDGYITEKIFNCFFSKSIPLYSGSNNICNYFNNNSFINIDDINKLDENIKLIEELNNNELLYNSYINTKKINDNYDDENFLEVMKEYIDNLSLKPNTIV